MIEPADGAQNRILVLDMCLAGLDYQIQQFQPTSLVFGAGDGANGVDDGAMLAVEPGMADRIRFAP